MCVNWYWLVRPKTAPKHPSPPPLYPYSSSTPCQTLHTTTKCQARSRFAPWVVPKGKAGLLGREVRQGKMQGGEQRNRKWEEQQSDPHKTTGLRRVRSGQASFFFIRFALCRFHCCPFCTVCFGLFSHTPPHTHTHILAHKMAPTYLSRALIFSKRIHLKHFSRLHFDVRWSKRIPLPPCEGEHCVGNCGHPLLERRMQLLCASYQNIYAPIYYIFI